jgi:hypothetical protein
MHESIFPTGAFELVFNLRDDELRIYEDNESLSCSRYSEVLVSRPCRREVTKELFFLFFSVASLQLHQERPVLAAGPPRPGVKVFDLHVGPAQTHQPDAGQQPKKITSQAQHQHQPSLTPRRTGKN